MKTVFIVNPKAGQGKNIEGVIERIKQTADKLKAETHIYVTKAVGDAERFVREYCKTNGVARFIACGGDGTLSEVLNGAVDTNETEIGVLPMGTGNDFCRNFDTESDFASIESQINSKCVKCDIIKYKTSVNGEEKSGYCVNMVNIGFDCNVADMTAKMKEKPLISGSFAYLLSIFAILIKKKGANLKIELDGQTKHTGPLLLTSIANGSYCGGGVKSNPIAQVQDGFININIIKNVSRIKFIKLLPYYMKGTFLKLRGIDKIISSVKCKKITITPLDGNMRLCNDGEISDAGTTEFEIIHNAINFVVPGTFTNEHSEYTSKINSTISV